MSRAVATGKIPWRDCDVELVVMPLTSSVTFIVELARLTTMTLLQVYDNPGYIALTLVSMRHQKVNVECDWFFREGGATH